MAEYDQKFSEVNEGDIVTIKTAPQLEIEEKIYFTLDDSNTFNLHPQCTNNFESLMQDLNVPSLKILKSMNKISQALKFYLQRANLAKIEDLKPDAIAWNYLIFSIGLMGIFCLFLIIDSYWVDDNVLSYIGIFFITASLIIQGIIIFINGRCKCKRCMSEVDYDALKIKVEKTKEIVNERNRKMVKLNLMWKVDEDTGGIELIKF